jgi:hypothetical protein
MRSEFDKRLLDTAISRDAILELAIPEILAGEQPMATVSRRAFFGITAAGASPSSKP